MRLIDADDLSKKLSAFAKASGIVQTYFDKVTLQAVAGMLKDENETPTIDPIKHGRWVNRHMDEEGFDVVHCSVCGGNTEIGYSIDGTEQHMMGSYNIGYTHCPWCGARLEQE